MPAVIEAMNTTTIRPAAAGMGAAVTARAMRPYHWFAELKCSQTV